jgi:hypothetical protein
MPWEKGQSGNEAGSSERQKFGGALSRAIAQDDGKRLRAAAESLLTQAASGEAWAIKELADRLDGKPAQAITGKDGDPIEIVARWLSEKS